MIIYGMVISRKTYIKIYNKIVSIIIMQMHVLLLTVIWDSNEIKAD